MLRATAAAGVALEGLSAHGGGDEPPGVVLGYASRSVPEIEAGLALVANALTGI